MINWAIFPHPAPRTFHLIYFFYFRTQTDLDSVTRNTSVKIANLPHALKLMDEWEAELSVTSAENTAYIAHLLEDVTSQARKTFPDLMVNKILNSKVFIYPRLLPHVPFFSESTNPKLGSYQFINAED